MSRSFKTEAARKAAHQRREARHSKIESRHSSFESPPSQGTVKKYSGGRKS